MATMGHLPNAQADLASLIMRDSRDPLADGIIGRFHAHLAVRFQGARDATGATNLATWHVIATNQDHVTNVVTPVI